LSAAEAEPLSARANRPGEVALAGTDGGELIVGGLHGDRQGVRGADGKWVYLGTPAGIPGARDVVATEILDPLVVGREGGERQAVVFSLDELKLHPRLHWVLGKGTEITIDGRPHFWVSWSDWQEYANEPVSLDAPELGPPGLGRHLACVEGDVRLARYELDSAGRRRLEMLLVLTLLGWTRRALGTFVGLSGTRVQQLLEDAPDDLVDDVHQLLRDATRLVRSSGQEPIQRERFEPPRGWDRAKVDRLFDRLVELELAEQDGDTLTFTHEARVALAKIEDRRIAAPRRAGAPR
jgi:hypothetical protein